jgi:hypothetical protein
MAIKINPAHKGRLHRALGIPDGKPIPVEREEAAKHSPNPRVRQEANFALNARGFKHK